MTLEPTDLLGRWTLDRTIYDHLEGTTITVTGTAEFVTPAPGRIDWVESGVLHLPAGDVPITATRHLRQEPDGAWATDFADGRAFHAWGVGVELVHECSPDMYRGRLEPELPAAGRCDRRDAWTMQWAATGPTKDYVIDSRYNRADG
ncbi:MAG: hypothetical protein JWP75_1496 [Frondihabitans sp.]|nr:hypothetical protein [Frondihabitans sp.]